MILLALLALARAGDAEDLVLARARADLADGRGAAARDAVLPLLGPSDAPAEAWEVWLGAMEGVGLGASALDELEQLATIDPTAAVVHAVRRVRLGETDPGPVAALASDAPGLVRVKLAELAVDVRSGQAALDALGDADDADAVEWRIAALRLAERDGDALKAAEAARAQWPDRPDRLIGLWTTPRASRAVAKAQQKLLASIAAEADTGAALWAYRARDVALVASDLALAERLGARLVALGEPARLARGAWSERICHDVGKQLSGQLIPVVPPCSDPERRWIVEALAAGLEDVGRRPDALKQLQAARRIDDSPELARQEARMWLSASKVQEAIDAATFAVVDGARPVGADTGRVDLIAQRRDLAEGLSLWAAALASGGRPGDAMEAASLAAAVDPSGPWEDLRTRLAGRPSATLGPEDALARAEAALAAGKPDVARKEVSTAVARLAYRPTESFRGPDTSAALAQALELSAQARGPAEADLALVDIVVASLIAPSPQRFVARGQRYEALGWKDAAFVSYAEAVELGASVSPQTLGAVWASLVPPTDAAAYVASQVNSDPPDDPVRELKVTSTQPREGMPLPAFVLETSAGPRTAEGLRGKVVVLSFFASWCGPCRVELPALDAMIVSLAARGVPVELLAVSVDDARDDYERFRRGSTAKATTWAWSPELGRQFRARALPALWLVGPDGTVLDQHVGWDDGVPAQLEREILAATSR